MRFLPTIEQNAFAEAIDDVAGAQGDVAIAQAAARGDSAPWREAWAQLGEMGVIGLRVADDEGGIGAEASDLAVVFERLGYHGLPGPYIESVALLPHLVDGTTRSAIATGEVIATASVVGVVPAALDAAESTHCYLVADGRIHLATPGESLGSISPVRRLARLDPTDAGRPLDATSLDAALDETTLAASAVLIGAGERLLEEAVSYAAVREQFGHPIGEFQALKHALADVRVGLSFARPLVWSAALATQAGAPTRARDVSVAKVAAGAAADRAARAALQVHGAIGYTEEHHLGLWITQVQALRSAWGTADVHRARIARALRAE
ncbi:acyl-CoA dehydrogenase family protein [Herbiconiux sp. P17]|uniref:acyl-CoA dehydrogenase family protein n=1 Tax=Herbiconiux wuyangfengii TaxID=3342794 RepID=UPI0035B91752